MRLTVYTYKCAYTLVIINFPPPPSPPSLIHTYTHTYTHTHTHTIKYIHEHSGHFSTLTLDSLSSQVTTELVQNAQRLCKSQLELTLPVLRLPAAPNTHSHPSYSDSYFPLWRRSLIMEQ